MSEEDDEETYSSIRTVLGGTHRRERWHLTDEVDVLTALGRSRFDLRDVETTGRDVVEINIACYLGSVRLVVPPGTMVVLDGTSFLASASSVVERGVDSGLPRIEVNATTVLGKVKVISAELDHRPEVDSTEPSVAPVVAAVASEPSTVGPVDVEPVHDEPVDVEPVHDEPVADPDVTVEPVADEADEADEAADAEADAEAEADVAEADVAAETPDAIAS